MYSLLSQIDGFAWKKYYQHCMWCSITGKKMLTTLLFVA
uniref:Uncharacterized protein n=1 Tax=Rhizophora mucronata TaxID=61149 RepID=A0A2P2PRY8_RHIMU